MIIQEKVTQLGLPGIAEDIIVGTVESELSMRYRLSLSTEMSSDMDLDIPMPGLLETSGAAHIQGGYNDRLGEWVYFLDIPATTPFRFLRNLAYEWQDGMGGTELRATLELVWLTNHSIHQSVILADSIDLSQLRYTDD